MIERGSRPVITGSLGMASVLAMVVFAGVGSVAAQEAAPPDQAQLESLCAENAQSNDDLATCLDIVRRVLVPPPGSEIETPVAATDSLMQSGQGDGATDAFMLAGGDYVATLIASDTDGDGYVCYASALLRNTEDNAEASRLRVQAPQDETNEVISYLYGIPAGRYYWDFEYTSCQWDLTLESVELDHTDQPDGPVTVNGTDTLDSRSFILTGGEYVVDYEVSAAENGNCEFFAYLIPADEPELWASAGDVSVDAEIGSGAAERATFYAVEPGEYYWSARVLAFSAGYAPCEWALTVTQA